MELSLARSDSPRPGVMSLGTIVVVEDPLVSRLVRAVLQRHGYEVKLASPAEAAALLKAPDPAAGVLITNSPGAFLEFADRVPLLYLTSSADVVLKAAFSVCRVVVKPFVPEQLVRTVDALMAPE